MMGSSAAVPPEFKKNFNKRPSCKAVPLTRWKQNKPDSAACVWFLFLSFPFLWIWSLFCTELKGSRVWQVRASWLDSCQSHSEREGIAESRITGGGLVALTAERQIQCVQHTVHRSCYDTHTRTHASTLRHTHTHTYTCMGGFIAMATSDWSPELCCERGNINDGEQAALGGGWREMARWVRKLLIYTHRVSD